jgi:ribosomal protein L44E
MKLPKELKRHCPYCGEHTVQTILHQKQRSRSTSHPMSRWGPMRVHARGLRRGAGNDGKFSKKPPKDQKMKSKTTKRITLLYKCKKCGKQKGIKKAIRASRIMIGEKVAK